MAKIIVDEMPEKWSDCPFRQIATTEELGYIGVHKNCSCSNERCLLEDGGHKCCDRLISMTGYQIEYGMLNPPSLKKG